MYFYCGLIDNVLVLQEGFWVAQFTEVRHEVHRNLGRASMDVDPGFTDLVRVIVTWRKNSSILRRKKSVCVR